MSFQLNLSALTETARDRLARLETSGTAIRDRFRSPPPRSSSTVSALPPEMSRAPLGSTSELEQGVSGESPVLVRMSGGGGGVSLLSVFEMTPNFASSLCLGSVGNGFKFCTLGASHCTFSTHSKKVSVKVDALYIAAGRNSAFANHFLESSFLSTDQLESLLQEHHSKEEWVQLFHSWKSNSALHGAQPNSFTASQPLMSVIKPPKRYRSDYSSDSSQGDHENALGSMSLESEFDVVNIPADDLRDFPQEEAFARMLLHWEDLTSNVNKCAVKIRRLQSSSQQNWESMDAKIESVDARLGQPVGSTFADNCITSWDGIGYVDKLIATTNLSLAALKHDYDTTVAELKAQVSTYISKVDGMVSEVSRGFSEVSEFIRVVNDEQIAMNQVLRNRLTHNTSTSVGPLEQEMQELRVKVDQIQAAVSVNANLPVPPQIISADEMSNLKIQMRLLEARLPSHNVLKLGGNQFQSRADVALFVETKVPSNAFSMFHDVVTLMERLSGNYVERKEVINEWYQATKVGLDEREARHIASFKITYPTVFGHVKEGATPTKHHLPALKSFKEWNSFDSESGVKAFIANGMEDLKLQLYQDIFSIFSSDQFHDARMLAHDMHSKSQIFVAEMSNWMDVFYQELLSTSEATEDEAWDLVSACIKKVFEELRRVRAGAANATTEALASSKCATILWALIQSHRVMKDFLDSRFRNHPSIAPVIVLHVFKTRVTRVAHANLYKRLEGRVAKLESSSSFKSPKQTPKDGEADKKSTKD